MILYSTGDLCSRSSSSHNTIGFCYRGYDIHLKSYLTYLFFYIVDEDNATVTVLRVLQDGMN